MTDNKLEWSLKKEPTANPENPNIKVRVELTEEFKIDLATFQALFNGLTAENITQRLKEIADESWSGNLLHMLWAQDLIMADGFDDLTDANITIEVLDE